MLLYLGEQQCNTLKRIMLDQVKREDNNELPYGEEDQDVIYYVIDQINKSYI